MDNLSVVLGILAFLGYKDFRYREVPRWSIIVFLGAVLIEMALNPYKIYGGIISFIIVFVLGFLLHWKMDFGKADWLVTSIVALVFGSLGIIVVGAGMLFAFIYSFIKEMRPPVIPFIALSALLFALINA